MNSDGQNNKGSYGSLTVGGLWQVSHTSLYEWALTVGGLWQVGHTSLYEWAPEAD